VAAAEYGLDYEGLRQSWGNTTDPHHPSVGFRAGVELDDAFAPGRHWLGLRFRGADGSVELWPEQPIIVGD
jgi:hypothetical protein